MLGFGQCRDFRLRLGVLGLRVFVIKGVRGAESFRLGAGGSGLRVFECQSSRLPGMMAVFRQIQSLHP